MPYGPMPVPSTAGCSRPPKQFFLDKTPAYGLVLPFLTKLYPKAKYIVLTRHPLAITHSQAHSFFAGDYQAAWDTNPLAPQYVPAIASMMRDRKVEFVHVRYDDVVSDPESAMRKICSHLSIDFEQGTVDYGKQQHITKSYGDPMSVEKHQRPVTDSLEKWAKEALAKPEVMEIALRLRDELDDDDLRLWGYPKEEFLSALEGQEAARTSTPVFNTYKIKRQIMLNMRRNVQQIAGLEQALRKMRYYCDVLLREQ